MTMATSPPMRKNPKEICPPNMRSRSVAESPKSEAIIERLGAIRFWSAYKKTVKIARRPKEMRSRVVDWRFMMSPPVVRTMGMYLSRLLLKVVIHQDVWYLLGKKFKNKKQRM